MKLSRKTFWLIIALLIVASMLVGCDDIPDEYIKGVKLDSSYPEDDLPIMEDAVVYFCDADDETISLKYGVEDELDDVADFYKDHFEDNEIVLDDESDRSSRYTAQGRYKDFEFEIKASAPSGTYEEKVFETIVKVDIEFIDDSLGSISDLQTATPAPYSLAQDIIGFWRQESFEDSTGKTATYDFGTAYEFLSDGTLKLYVSFVFVGTGGWAYVDESTIMLTSIDGSQENVSVALEKRSEKDYLVWTDSTGTLTFFRDVKDEFGTDSTGDMPTMSGDDAQLAASIADRTWYYVHYLTAENQVQNSLTGYVEYNSDGTLYDELGSDIYSGTWYVSDGGLYCEYDDGSNASWEIEVGTLSNTNYLTYYSSSEPGAYWLYIDMPRSYYQSFSNDNIFYLTDSELTYALSGLELHEFYYLYTDGTTEEMVNNTMTFYQDGTFEDYYVDEDSRSTGTWQFGSGYLEMYYDNNESSMYPAYIEYDNQSGAYFIYLGDMEEGYEGCYWVFTTYEP